MIIRLRSLSVPYHADQGAALCREVNNRLGRLAREMERFEIVRRSIDARMRPVSITYSVDVTLKTTPDAQIHNAIEPPEVVSWNLSTGSERLSSRPVVVGGGPAGLFAALLLAIHGFRPLLIDRGGTVSERIRAIRRFHETRTPVLECNALFGLGGAGTFSDGKLMTGLRHPWIPNVLDTFKECGAPARIVIDAKPHIGTDVLVEVVENLVHRIQTLGGTVTSGVRLDRLVLNAGRIEGIETSAGRIDCDALVLAIGHSARDTWQSLSASGVTLEPKPFQLGIRVEHEQSWIDSARYGEAAGHPELGAADYKLATKVDGVPVFTFCMCPGGETIPTVNETRCLAINGMSESARNSEFGSSGLVVTLLPEVYGGRCLASCLAFQRSVEQSCFAAGNGDYSAPAQRLVDFAKGVATEELPATSYRMGASAARLDEILPRFVSSPIRRSLSVFDARIKGYLHPTAVALAPESRASSPVRIVRDPVTMESPSISRLYPVGEGAGYAGGIMSAALDGLNAARRIIETFAVPE